MEAKARLSPEEVKAALGLRRFVMDDYQQVILNLRNAGFPGLVIPRLLAARINNDPDAILVAVIGREVVGSVYLHGETDGHLSSVVVKSSYRRMGVGSRMICEAERIFKEKGAVRYI